MFDNVIWLYSSATSYTCDIIKTYLFIYLNLCFIFTFFKGKKNLTYQETDIWHWLSRVVSDNDECALHMCDHLGPGYRCRNTLGFFRCDKIFNSVTTEKPSSSAAPTFPMTLTQVSLKCPRGYYPGSDRQCLGKPLQNCYWTNYSN